MAALINEVVWFKLLSLHAGARTSTLAALLVGFLGGLGLGGRLFAGAIERTARPLRILAWVELGAAALGASSMWTFPAAIRLLDALAGALPADVPEGPAAPLAAAALVLIPASLMGASLPAAVRACSTGAATAGSASSWLYGANTLGGAAGSLAAGFVLLPALGISRTLWAASAVQIVAAGGALALDQKIVRRIPAASGSAPAAAARLPALLASCVLAGGAALVAEIAWTQVFQAAFGSSTYSLAAVLTVYLAGLGLGGLLPSSRLDRVPQPALLFALLQVGAAIALLLIFPLLGRLPLWVAPLSARLAGHPLLLYASEGLLAGLVLLPLTTLLGASFPVACRALVRNERIAPAVGSAALANAAGSIAGIVLGGVWLETHGLRSTLYLAAALHAAAGLLIVGRRLTLVPAPLTAAAAGVLALALLLSRARWDPHLLSSGAYLHGPLFTAGAVLGSAPLSDPQAALGRLRFYRESREGVVSVREGWNGALSLAVNGRTEASSGVDLASQLWIGHLPALLRPQARSALVVGLASGFTVGALARHPLQRIDCVELSSAVAEAASEFDSLTGAPLRDPRVRLHIADARRWLARHSGSYDLIVSQPSNFWVAGVSALFTREFFELARQRLAPGGLVAVWLQAYSLDPEDFRSALATFVDVFPSATLWEEALAGGDYFILGSPSDIPLDWPQVARTLALPGVRDVLRPLGVRSLGELLAHRVTGRQGLERLARSAPRITDDNLRLEFRAPLHLRRASVPEVVRLLTAAGGRRADLDLSALGGALQRETLATLSELERRRERDSQVLELLAAEGESLSLDPRLHRSATLLAGGWARAASQELAELLSSEPRSSLGWLLLGSARLADPQEHPAAAAQALARAAELRPQDPTAWNLLGKALTLAGRPQEARSALGRALTLRADFPEALNNRAALALREGRDLDALPDLERAVALAPDSAPLRVNLGLTLRRLGRSRDSRRIYEEGLVRNPLEPDLHFNMATLDLAEERPAAALEGYRRAASLGGPDALTERGQGLALLALGRGPDARPHLEESLRLDSRQSDLKALLRSLAGQPGAHPRG